MRKAMTLALAAALWAAAFGLPAVAGAKPLRLMLDWFPNVDHLPVYLARQAGEFAAEGIEVEILSPSDTADSLKLAAAGRVELAVSYQPQATIAASEGLDIRVVGRLVGHPLTTLLFLESSGFGSPADLSGKTIGYTVPGLMDVLLAAFAKVNGIVDYTPVNVGFAIVPSLTSGRVDAVMGPFKTYETVTMDLQGLAAGYFELEKWGIPAYDELVFVSGAAAAAGRSSDLRAFRRAVARGIERARRDPEAALKAYFEALPDADRETETRAFERTLPYFAEDQRLDRARWETFAAFALAHGLIRSPVAVDKLFLD
jgi:putative hydroxymethylpyrimidine transport system substrate-binding protein